MNMPPSEMSFAWPPARALGAFRHELDGDIDGCALVSTKLDHGRLLCRKADDTIRAVDDFNRRREARDALWLALVPLGVALVLGVLLLPRRASPESVPLPVVDARALERVVSDDHERAAHARNQPLPPAVRALGSTVRDFHTLEASDVIGKPIYDARRAVDDALVEVLRRGPGVLLGLRAVQLEGFLVEIHRFEATGEQSDELKALAGAFVRSITIEGWCDGRAVAPGDDVLRAMFKQMWASLLNLEANPAFAPRWTSSAPSTPSIFAPAPCEATRDASTQPGVARATRTFVRWPSARRSARPPRRGGSSASRASPPSIPAYPADYARGIASYRRGDFALSARAFRSWLRDHPEGPLALRAQNFLRAAVGRAARGVASHARAARRRRPRARAAPPRLPGAARRRRRPRGGRLAAPRRASRAVEPYDIVLLDVMLPAIDGFEVCRRDPRRATTSPS